MIDPSIIAGGIQAGASLIGGLLGNSAQDRANSANLQIAQEYNQMQRDIAAQNNKLQYQMFQESNYYNSPANQRKMLEAAGYNPYSLYTNPSGGASYAQSLPSLQQPQMTMPQVQPNFQFSNALQNAMGNVANVVKTLSEADKAASEKKLVDLNVQAFGQRLANEFALAGYEQEAAQLRNGLARDTYDQNVYRVTLENLLGDAELVSKNIGIKRAAFDYELNAAFGFKLKQKEFEKLSSEIYRNIEEGKTFADQRLTNQINRYATLKGVSQRDVELRINRMFAQAAQTSASAAQTSASANLLDAKTRALVGAQTERLIKGQASRQEMENIVYSIFGKPSAAQDFLNKVATGRLTNAEFINTYELFKNNDIINDYTEFEKIMDGIKKMSDTGSSMKKWFDFIP